MTLLSFGDALIRFFQSFFTEDGFRIPLGAWVEGGITFLTTYFSGVFTAARTVLDFFFAWAEFFLKAPPFWVIILVIAGLALLARRWILAIGSIPGLLIIVGVNQWENAMETLAMVLVASAIAIVFSVPLGILGAKSRIAAMIMRPILDLMQTLPVFVYLIPALLLFRVGVAPGIFATIIFAMAPGVRLTQLGIQNVDREVVEAGQAFGSTPWRVLRQIQLPLALPTIMAGVNQVIMLSLSMVVIAGMVGAGGLGGEVVRGLGSLDIPLGFEAGLSVVIIAIILDRLSGVLGQQRQSPRRRSRPAPAAAAEAETPAAEAATEELETQPTKRPEHEAQPAAQ
ncbi:ABC transporter permease [Microlunatus parietis]|uniref:ABC-type proline/glycine betaine transport system permease subunit n=1 Tax=Microlunatus parietis TaxID=682979 RepID=A0A7Y9I4Q0_9ACTN|nr:ABC transporter permease subunit [Microlunatus parietis]NYE69970.1 ABC-type proline/glycine betaine transport system permease subunit [Microlunatus parietis]